MNYDLIIHDVPVMPPTYKEKREAFLIIYKGKDYYIPFGAVCTLIRFAHVNDWAKHEDITLLDKAESLKKMNRLAKYFGLSATQLFEKRNGLRRLAVESIYLDRESLKNFEDVTIANLFKEDV